MSHSLYDDLGVAHDATADEIKKAYKGKAKESHPDVGGDTESMALITRAYSILSNPDKRRRYDETGETAATQPFQARFLSFCNQNWMKVVQNAQSVDHDDLIEEFVDQCHAIIETIERNISQTEKQLKVLEKVNKRLKKKTGDDSTLIFIVNEQIQSHKASIKLMEEELVFMEQAIEVLETYGYDADPRPVATTAGIQITFT